MGLSRDYEKGKKGTMGDLISRQAAIEVIDSFNVCESRCDQIKLEQMIGELPPAQPERIKGHWIDAVIPNDSGGLPVIVCDKCNTFFPLQFGDSHNFCPNCGADMRGEGVKE